MCLHGGSVKRLSNTALPMTCSRKDDVPPFFQWRRERVILSPLKNTKPDLLHLLPQSCSIRSNNLLSSSLPSSWAAIKQQLCISASSSMLARMVSRSALLAGSFVGWEHYCLEHGSQSDGKMPSDKTTGVVMTPSSSSSKRQVLGGLCLGQFCRPGTHSHG